MNQTEKDQILNRTKKHVEQTCFLIRDSIAAVKTAVARKKENFKTLGGEERVVFAKLLHFEEQRAAELEHLKGSPYFVKCDVTIDGEQKTWFFGKFGYKESDIFSWVTPAASIRFEQPGAFTYKHLDDAVTFGQLNAKEQYMIVDGNILFLAVESEDHPRELVYQEHFSTRKTVFVLPEIVAQMERAQDQVIRAHPKGPFVISGPAGSGKTTLALHRIAYLVQSPETTEIFPPESIIVFVQDQRTKDYFSHILPELGITNVTITTFSEWAIKILDLRDVMFVDRHVESEPEQDAFERAKLKVLQTLAPSKAQAQKRVFGTLEGLYANSFTSDQMTLFQKQSHEQVLDRYDLTVLLSLAHASDGQLSIVKDYYIELKNGKLKKKTGPLSVGYTLVLMDEFQNYLPEQLQLIKSCKREDQQSMMYVGDIAQQVRFGTLRDWSQINEQIPDDRSVSLTKVYRNTKEILTFIASLGYDVEIPPEVKQGAEVVQLKTASVDEEVAYIRKTRDRLENHQTIGVLAKQQRYLTPFEQAFSDDPQVRVFEIKEAQGVEFDVVCLVGVDADTFIDLKKDQEKTRILRNLIYIALTRAMSELHILGKEPLAPM